MEIKKLNTAEEFKENLIAYLKSEIDLFNMRSNRAINRINCDLDDPKTKEELDVLYDMGGKARAYRLLLDEVRKGNLDNKISL